MFTTNIGYEIDSGVQLSHLKEPTVQNFANYIHVYRIDHQMVVY